MDISRRYQALQTSHELEAMVVFALYTFLWLTTESFLSVSGKFQKELVEVTLDPDTAHPQLHISNWTAVTHKDDPQEVPDSEKRFTEWKSVVAFQSFSSGKHYWEVDVGHQKEWCLGVCRDDVNRKLAESISTKIGYWIFGLTTNGYFTFNPHKIALSPCISPTRVGIFLDCEGGTISFFNINDKSLIYTLTFQFEKKLRPYIAYWSHHSEKPLVICTMS
ncbi:PREDICTED: butyrophilin-like protein 3 [Chrysochloris asiatica]|uniref:Butyrophilin-like protein 3 n=1 Tax=Chrysochloris asiatica TaxID=185453 RepID=A0A9B0UCE2_CHRAS|nr:PREDICTED: butyrophilin-like protein 3 [Chrysochloris asiatica]